MRNNSVSFFLRTAIGCTALVLSACPPGSVDSVAVIETAAADVLRAEQDLATDGSRCQGYIAACKHFRSLCRTYGRSPDVEGTCRDTSSRCDSNIAAYCGRTTRDSGPHRDGTAHFDAGMDPDGGRIDTISLPPSPAGSLTITINAHTLPLGGDVRNYPLALRLNTTNFPDIATRTKPHGADLRFETTGGASLPHEIEGWQDGNSGAVWVLVDRISRSAPTTIVMKYDNTSPSGASDGASVFKTANGFRGVWHLNEPAVDEQTTAVHRDATSTANNGVQAGNAVAAGLIGMAQRFDGTDDQINVAHDTSLVMTNRVSMSAWVKLETSPAEDEWYTVLASSNAPSGTSYYSTYIFHDGKEGNLVCVDFLLNTGRKDLWNAGQNIDIGHGPWTHIATTFDGSEFRFYVDGVRDSKYTESGTIVNASTMGFKIAQSDGSDNFHGVIDEARVANTVFSADWIKLDYETQKPGQTTVAF